MKQKSLVVLVGLLALMLALAVPAQAGGWATITLDRWPDDVVVGQATTISFTVRQHGRDDALMSGLNPLLKFRNVQDGGKLEYLALQLKGEGRYAAEVTFPSAGEWAWTIEVFSSNQPMPALEVAAAAPVASSARAAQPAGLPAIPLAAGGLGVAFIAGLIALIGGRRVRWALVLVVVGLLAGGVGLALAASQPALARPDAAAPVSAASDAQVALGEKLFVAKGCVVCHSNNRISQSYIDIQTDVGPNLSNYQASPEFLRVWLKDPQAAKPQTQMPNLELKETEIEALIAFLSAHD